MVTPVPPIALLSMSGHGWEGTAASFRPVIRADRSRAAVACAAPLASATRSTRLTVSETWRGLPAAQRATSRLG
jgi:hypothetical protein